MEIQLIAMLMGAFLAGSIPFGYLIGKAKGVDVRKVGSGNIGATNVGRVLGRKYFFLCFGLDVLKGLLPTLGMGYLLKALGSFELSDSVAAWWLGAMVASVFGHMFSPWVGFKGGKGVATSLGALLGVFPLLTVAGLGAFAVFGVVVAVWRYISLGSIAAAVALPRVAEGVMWLGVVDRLGVGAGGGGGAFPRCGWVVLGVLVALSGLVIWKHRANVGRLRAGTEPKAGQKKAAG